MPALGLLTATGLALEQRWGLAWVHAQGSVGIEDLLTTKWQLQGEGQSVADFDPKKGGPEKYVHEDFNGECRRLRICDVKEQ